MATKTIYVKLKDDDDVKAKGPLFRTIAHGTGQLSGTPLLQANAYAMVRRRAATVTSVSTASISIVRSRRTIRNGLGKTDIRFVSGGNTIVVGTRRSRPASRTATAKPRSLSGISTICCSSKKRPWRPTTLQR